MAPDPVQIAGRESMNLLGLILAAILRRNVGRGVRLPARGVLGITAGTMCCAMEFAAEGVTIRRGRPDRARARLAADLETLVALARSPLAGGVSAFFRGRLRLGGNPLFLLRLLPLLKA